MKKKRKTKKVIKTLKYNVVLEPVQDDSILKDMNPSEPASPMMGLASQLEKDMFLSSKDGLTTIETKGNPEKDADPKQPGEKKEESCECAGFLIGLAVVALLAVGAYFVFRSDVRQGNCFAHTTESGVYAKVDYVYSSWDEVRYEMVDYINDTYRVTSRTESDFKRVYSSKEEDCNLFDRYKNRVLGLKTER